MLFAVSLHGTVYAFDTDGRNLPSGSLWSTSVIPAGETDVTTSDYYGCGNPSPYTTVLGTPVIDRATQTMYLVSKTKSSTTSAIVQRLHALSLLDGSEKFGGPTVIQASVPGTGNGSTGGVLAFDPLSQNERSALLLANGTVWIAWASHCDQGNYHGWVMGYNASILTQSAVFVNTPSGAEGGIWMSAGGPSADANGFIYVVGGNGTFTLGEDYSDAALKLQPPAMGTTMSVADYFVPSNQAALSGQDQDMGMAQPLLFTDSQSNVAPQLLVTADKTGKIYLLNTNHMGTYDSGAGGVNGELQDFGSGGSNLFVNFVYFNGSLYVSPGGQAMRAFTFFPGNSVAGGTFSTTPSSMTTFSSTQNYTSGGYGPMISANGNANGIMWAVARDTSPTVLYGLDASDLSKTLYSSSTAPSGRDTGPAAVKFANPLVANGMVFVPGSSMVVEYGLF